MAPTPWALPDAGPATCDHGHGNDHSPPERAAAALVKDGTMYVEAGCGVVAHSNPEAECEVTRQEARALFRAAEEAVRFAAGKVGR